MAPQVPGTTPKIINVSKVSPEVVQCEGDGEELGKDFERARFDASPVRSGEVERPGQVVQVRAPRGRRHIQASQSLAASTVSRARVMLGDGSSQTARARVDQQPEVALRVAIEFEEMVAASESPEVAAGQSLADMLQGSGRERGGEQRVGDGRALSPMRRLSLLGREGAPTCCWPGAYQYC